MQMWQYLAGDVAGTLFAVGIVQDQQPAPMPLEPAKHGADPALFFGFTGLGQVQPLVIRQQDEARPQGLRRIGTQEKHPVVVGLVIPGVFHRETGLAYAAEPLQRKGIGNRTAACREQHRLHTGNLLFTADELVA